MEQEEEEADEDPLLQVNLTERKQEHGRGEAAGESLAEKLLKLQDSEASEALKLRELKRKSEEKAEEERELLKRVRAEQEELEEEAREAEEAIERLRAKTIRLLRDQVLRESCSVDQ